MEPINLGPKEEEQTWLQQWMTEKFPAQKKWLDDVTDQAFGQAANLLLQDERVVQAANITFGGNIYGDEEEETELSRVSDKVSEYIEETIEEKSEQFRSLADATILSYPSQVNAVSVAANICVFGYDENIPKIIEAGLKKIGEKIEEFDEKAHVANEKFGDRKEINPDIQALEVEVARLLFPTLGKIAGGLESTLETIWNVVSDSFYLRGGINLLGLKYKFEPVLDILDAGFGTGQVEKGLTLGKEAVKPQVLDLLKNAEQLIGDNLAGRVQPVALQIPAVESTFKTGVKKVGQFVLSVFSNLGKLAYHTVILPYHVACLLNLVKVKEIGAPYPKTPEQDKMDEAIHQLIHNPIHNALQSLPLGRYLLPIGEKVGNILESIISTRLQFFRDHLIGEKNAPSVERLLNNLEKNSIKGLGDNLREINNLYFEGKEDEMTSHEIENRIMNEFYHPGLAVLTKDEVKTMESKKVFLNQVVQQIDMAIAEKTAKQTEIQKNLNSLLGMNTRLYKLKLGNLELEFAKNSDHLKALEVAKKNMLKPEAPYINSVSPQVTALIIESKHNRNYKETQNLKLQLNTKLSALEGEKELVKANKYAPTTALPLIEKKIQEANASFRVNVENLNNGMDTFVNDLKALKAVEDKMFQTEKAYISGLSELILDTLIFPNGMPFYLNIPVLLPNAAELGISLFNLQDRTFGEGAINLTRSVFNKSITFKMQFARTYLLETISSALVVGLNLGLDQAQLAEPALNKVRDDLNDKLPTNRKAMGGFNISLMGLIGDMGRNIMDPEDKLDVVSERLNMKQVNKRILFGMIDEVVNTFKAEAKTKLEAKINSI